MKLRRHHNNEGLQQIRRGKTRTQVEAIARRLGIPYGRADVRIRDIGDLRRGVVTKENK